MSGSRRGQLAAALLMMIAAAAALIAVQIPTAAYAQQQAEPQEATYVTSASLRDRAMAEFRKKVGGEALPPISKLDFTRDRITVWTQDPSTAYYTNEWVISRFQLLGFDNDNIGGPTPVQGDFVVDRKEGGFFPFALADLGKIDAMVAAATEAAHLEGGAEIASITLNRAITILPVAGYGEPRWTIELRNPRESATIYAGLDGAITAADLSNTLWLQRLDLLVDDFAVEQAERQIAGTLAGRSLIRFYFSRQDITLEAEDGPGLKRDFSWSPAGIRNGMQLPNVSFDGTEGFTLDEVDFKLVGEVRRKAIEAYASPSAKIAEISAEKRADGPRAPEVLWKVTFTEPSRETGAVVLNAKAEVVTVELPPSRRPPEPPAPPLSNAGMQKFMARLEREFGKEAWFSEISLDIDGDGTVLVEDRQAPGTMARFDVAADRDTSRSFMSVMPGDRVFDESRAFRISDLSPMVGDIEGFEARTLETMAVGNIAPWRVTFSRQLLGPDDGRLLVEIRAGRDHGNYGGWATWALDGTVADVMLP